MTPPRRPVRPPAILLLLALAIAADVAAQEGDQAGADGVVDPEAVARPVASASRATGPITLDGRPDESAWRDAEVLTGFVQQEPNTGAPATYDTEVRVLYTDDVLYVAAINFDPEPRRAITAGLEHDFDSGASDIFGLVLDTFLDRRNSFLFLVNPHGAIRDEQTFDDSRNVVAAWDGVVRVRTAVRADAWTLEMAIPFTTLRFDVARNPQDWGVNFIRRIRRLNETSYWAPLERRHRIHRMSRAGTLTGLEGLRAGRNLSLTPYVLAGRSTGLDVAPGAAGNELNAGLDAKWGMTPSLTLDVTLNPDFAQTDVDREQVNLTRFSLFFPEQREFFIENAGSFTFGDQTERNYRMGSSLSDFTLFHSRRIGLDDAGRPVPILGGARLTGRVGSWDVGLMDMFTPAEGGRGAENFAVARARRKLFGNSDIGVISLYRSTASSGSESADLWNFSGGADANLRFGELVVNSYLARMAYTTEVADTTRPFGYRVDELDDWAGRLSIAFRDRLWNTSAMVKRVGESFRPGIGFVRRRAMHHYYGTVGLHPRPRVAWLRELNPYLEVDYITGLDGRLESRNAQAALGVDFVDGGGLDFAGVAQHERVDDAFTIAGVTIPAGGYDFEHARASYGSSGRRKLSGRIGVTAGEFWTGHRRSVDLRLAWRPHHALFIEGSVERNALVLSDVETTADVAGVRARYALSTRLFGSAFVQHNAEDDETVANVRLDWKHAPLSDVFLVFTQRQGPDGLLERTLVLKATRMVGW